MFWCKFIYIFPFLYAQKFDDVSLYAYDTQILNQARALTLWICIDYGQSVYAGMCCMSSFLVFFFLFWFAVHVLAWNYFGQFFNSDEVGFIHPSQFSALNEDAGDENMNFWNRDHKLGISTQVLLPLYRVAKHVFMTSIDEYKLQSNLSVDRGKIGHENMLLPSSNSSPYEVLEDEIMKHSKALLLLNSDFGTAWNARFYPLPILRL